jgi:hypothetical protein
VPAELPKRAGTRRLGIWLVLAGAIAVVVGVGIQAFSIVAYVRGAGEGALDLHRANSLVVHLGQLAIVIGAIWAWWRNWKAIVAALAFLALSFFQLFAIGDTDTETGWVYGLHGALAIVVLLAGVAYGEVALRDRGFKSLPLPSNGPKPRITAASDTELERFEQPVEPGA